MTPIKRVAVDNTEWFNAAKKTPGLPITQFRGLKESV